MTTSQTSDSPAEVQKWTSYDPNHPQIHRKFYRTLAFKDKILYVGGVLSGSYGKAFDIAMIDPEKQTLQVVKSTGDDLNELCWSDGSACYWKDSKIVVFGGVDWNSGACGSNVAIITLKDLDSETPTAHWERFNTANQLSSKDHSAYIYQNKMVVLGVTNARDQRAANPWYLDLENGSWNEIITPKEYNIFGPRVPHNNKLYIINTMRPNIIITVFDFDARSWDHIIGPEVNCGNYIVCPQFIDGKIYFILSSKMLKEIPAANFPEYHGSTYVLFVNNRMVLTNCILNQHRIYREFVSLPLDPPSKPTQVPQPSQKSLANLSSTQQIMLKLLQEAPYSDISFEVEDSIIAAHKWWLCKKSKYFANMFASGMVEAQASRIKIPDITAPTFQAFLEFLYADHVDLNNTLALELLQQADKYSVPELAKACEKYLAENLTPENYVVVSQMAEMLDIVLLREAVVNYIAKNIKQLKTRKDFEDISDCILRESIVKFIVK